jgi:hypothetical protein
VEVEEQGHRKDLPGAHFTATSIIASSKRSFKFTGVAGALPPVLCFLVSLLESAENISVWW